MVSRICIVLVVLGMRVFAAEQTLAEKLSAAVEAVLQKSGVPSISVAVVSEDKLIYAHAFGKANLAENRAANVNTRYAVGSVSKQFTVAAILLLAEEGRLSLDDKVSKYFPNLTRAGEISIRQLLNHTSGYEDFAPQDYLIPEWTVPTTPASILDRFANKPLNFDPGTKWQYSNTGYVLAGEIVEKVAGKSLVAYLREKIFDPLGMKSANDCSAAGKDPKIVDATAYTRFGMGPARPVAREAAGWYNGAGELCMTPSDLAKWDVAFIERKILSPVSYNAFLAETKLNNGDSTHYALGLSLGDLNGIPSFSHGGEVSGFLASNAVFPTRGGAVILLSNQDGINVTGPLSRQLASIVFLPQGVMAPETSVEQVRQILSGLQKGQIDRSLFTPNANYYFTETALGDLRASLTAIGNLKTVTPGGENLRGGMTHRSYRAEFEKKTLSLNVYLLPDGKYEQFLVVE
jgi:CubicO group peptidase (beta-lactamase class C family)